MDAFSQLNSLNTGPLPGHSGETVQPVRVVPVVSAPSLRCGELEMASEQLKLCLSDDAQGVLR